jgi:hypothetical protein
MSIPMTTDEHGLEAADLRSSADGRDRKGRFTPEQNRGRRRGSKNKLPRDVRKLVADHAVDIVEVMIDKACKGNVNAGAALLRLVVGPAKDKGEPIRLDLKQISTVAEAATAISYTIAATTCGKISPDAAKDIVAMLATLSKAYETRDLEIRLSAIETTIKNTTR